MARYLVTGGTGVWNSTTNWSATSGGASGASVPTILDDVIIDILSLNANITVNTTSACLTLNISSYIGTFAMNAQLTVNGNITLSSGMNISGTGLLNFLNSSTLTSNGKTWSSPISFGGTSKVYTLADDWTCTANVNFGGVGTIINGNTFYLSSGLATTASSTSGTTNFVLNGTGAWSGTGVLRNNLTINTAGTITMGVLAAYGGGILTYTAGTVITTGNTLTIVNGATLNTNGIIWNNITFSASTTHTLTSNLTLSGTWSQNSGVLVTINGFQVNVGSVLSSGGAGATLGTTNFLISGTTNVILGGTQGFKNNLTINSSGTVTITSLINYSVGTLTYISGTMSIVAPTLTINGSCTLNTNGILWNNITITLASTITLLSNLSLLGILTFPNAATTFLGAYTITTPNITTAAISSARIYTFEEGQIWNISTSLKLYGAGAGFKILLTSNSPTGYVTFNLYQGATQDVEFCAATRIDSSLGQTIWSYRTTLIDTLNWNEMSTTPGTISYTS